jgi:hypothetical protein
VDGSKVVSRTKIEGEVDMMQVQNFDMIEILSCDIFVIFAVFSLSS